MTLMNHQSSVSVRPIKMSNLLLTRTTATTKTTTEMEKGKEEVAAVVVLEEKLKCMEEGYTTYFKLKRRLLREMRNWWMVRNDAYRLGPAFYLSQANLQETVNAEVDNLRQSLHTMTRTLHKEVERAEAIAKRRDKRERKRKEKVAAAALKENKSV